MKKSFTYKYGRAKMTFELPSEQILTEVHIQDFPKIENLETAVLEAIRQPIGSKPLREIVQPGQTVAFICNDPTRVANTHLFLPILVKELNDNGIPDQAMRIVFALGTHRLMSHDEMVEAVGADLASRLTMYNSDCQDSAQFDYFGETSFGTPVYLNKYITEVDHVICTGSIVHHFFSGFGGGRKAVLPGVAAYETIRKNHSLMLDPNAILGKLDGNPVYEDQVEGAKLYPPSFLINVVLDEQKNFLKIFAGDFIAAHLEACKFVDQVYGVPVPELADIVIASCGGYPKDINIYQLQKTMDNAWCAVKPGGVVIILGECEEGSGSKTYEDTMLKFPSPEAVEANLRQNFQIGAHKAYAVTRLMKRADFILVSALDKQLAKQLLFTAVDSVDEALELAKAKVGNQPKITLMPQGSLTVPLVK
ncbi:nickel-dependent lactate racemase [Succinispira mobilis]|uniref:nickel-dependent lactate racemase n=1 Tax=Succinispira mobilis TaxID=78120 RepID=UPI00036636C3|nr:nickel-dependent lactate racemase [Succinispira mobilis]